MALYLVGSIISVKLFECLSFCDQKEKIEKRKKNIVYFREKTRLGFLSPKSLNIILKLSFIFTTNLKVHQKWSLLCIYDP